MFCHGRTESQSLVNPRAIALGAYSPLVSDTRDFGSNPAGLIGLTDWEFSATTYIPTTGSIDGFVFHGLTLGNRFLGYHAAAVQFSNGTLLEVVFPSQGIIVGPDPTTVDTKFAYSEQFSLGYAYGITEHLSAGTSIRLREEELTDTQYLLEDTVIIRLPDVVQSSTSWLVDLAVRWVPNNRLTTGLVVRNLLDLRNGDFAGEAASYQLDNDPIAAFDLSYRFSRSLVSSIQAGTDGTGAIGTEFSFASGVDVRGGLYFDEQESPFVFGFGTGMGLAYDFLQFDMSYLHFFDQTNRTGTIDPGEFDPAGITNLDLNPYSRDRFSLSVTARFGDSYVSQARIDGVEIQEAIFPAAREVYAYRPIGNAFVTNTSHQPLHLKVTCFVDQVMDEPTQSQPVYAMPGEQVTIPLTAVFNEGLDEFETTTIRDAEIRVSSTGSGEHDDEFRQRIVLHGRNAWDGSVEFLRYFVTPDDPSVIRYTRDVLLSNRTRLSDDETLGAFEKAQILFETFSGKLLYVGDPKQSADHVQFPDETLQLNSGDCDDMTVCFSSLLNSIGISTAFVDVVPPDDPSKSHVYLLFDSGVHPRNGSTISENPKRYVVRKGPDGVETIWIPIETTKITEGFETAWKVGAEEYFDDVEINLGLAKGWVRVVDVN